MRTARAKARGWGCCAKQRWLTGCALFSLRLSLCLRAQTILNRVDDGCVISLPLIAAIVVITALWTLLITHRPEYRSNKGRRTHQA